jgi:hypothetical protein
VVVGEPPEGFEIRTGSETLRRVPFVSWTGRLYLKLVSGLGQQCLDWQIPVVILRWKRLN